MPKGDGQGGNQRRPGRPANELGRLDLLLRRLELHRGCADGKEPSSEPREYHARMAQSVHDEIQKLTEANGGWKLEVLENSERFKEAISAWLTEGHEDELAVAQLDIDERLLTALDTRGVIWLRDLLQWTEPMILALPMVAESLLNDLKQKLAERGLKLREATADEEAALPPIKYRLSRPREAKRGPGRRTEDETVTKHRGILRGLADGSTLDALGRQFGMNSNAVGNLRRSWRRRVRSGDEPLEIARGLGFIHSPVRSRVVAYLKSLAR